MAVIGVLLANYFQDSEYKRPVNAFKRAGYEVVVLGLRSDVVKGKKEGIQVKIDRVLADADPAEYDALLIPGGFSPDILRAHAVAVQFVKRFMKLARPIFAICHGPQLLISADALRGRKVTCWVSIIQDVKNAGALYTDAEVVVDGNLVTSRKPGDIPAFVRGCLKILE